MRAAGQLTLTMLRSAARHPLASVSVLVLGLVGALALGAAGIYPGPASDDVSILVQATRSTLLTALLGTAVCLVAGTAIGVAAGIYAGHFNALVGWVAYVTASVPALIFLLVVLVDSGRSLTGAMIVLGLLTTAPIFLLARGTVLRVENRPTVHARRAEGLTAARLLARSVLPALRGGLLALGLLQFAAMIGLHSLLSFLDLGGDAGPTWGSLARHTLENPAGASTYSWLPIALLVLTLAGLATLGLSIRRSLGPPRPCPAPGPSTDDGDERWALREPLPSAWFRASALFDVRGLHIQCGAGAESGAESADLVAGVSLTIARGDVVGLLGAAHSGAHEIALAMGGLLGPSKTISAGSILFDGIELVGMHERSLSRLRGTGVSYLPRDPCGSLDPAFTVASHLRAPLRKAAGLSKTATIARSRELLRRVGFDDPQAILSLRPAELTPVMAVRVLLAGAISCDPHVVIAHEPTATLDAADEASILKLFHGLQQELELTVIVVTDQIRLLSATCQQVAVVQAGMIVEHASIKDLLEAPQHPYTRELLSAEPAT